MKKFIYEYRHYLFIVIAGIIVLAIGIIIKNPTVNEYIASHIDNVNHDVVDELYDSLEVNDCTVINLDSKDKNKEAILYVIFTKLNKDNKLVDEIKVSDYQEVAKELLGTETDVYPEKYHYGTYVYTKNNDIITREQVKCESSTKYVSKLFGYSQGINNLTVHIKVGYIKNNKVYDLENNELGAYSKDKLNSLLDNATTQEFIYKNDNDKYYLESVK